MKPATRNLLRQKGWGDEEIVHAEAALEKSGRQEVFFAGILFWSALLVIVTANVVIALILIPFLIVLTNWLLYILVIVLALVTGFLYNFLITDIGHLESKHHLLAGIALPVLALANMVAVVLVSNRFIADLQVQNQPHNAWVVAALFAVAFIVPYLVDRFFVSQRRNPEAE